jgi:exodeoxyribonuclease VII small subunit
LSEERKRGPELEKLDFEESLRRLEDIVGKLERGDAPLEEGLALFEEGVVLSRRCHQMLAEAEKKVSRLVRAEDGTFTLELFPREDEDS